MGIACTKDPDCGGPGRCLTELEGLTFPGGYCALPIVGSCLLDQDEIDEIDEINEDFPDGLPEDEPGLYLFQECETDAECRQDEGYFCQVGSGECLQDEPVFLDLHSAFEPPPLCAIDLGDFDDFWEDEDADHEHELD